MDISTKVAYGTTLPRGTATTLINLVTRDDQDEHLFPLRANYSKFIRDDSVRTVPMASIFRELTFRGNAEFGQTFMFDLLHTQCGDLVQGLYIQVKLGDWFPSLLRNKLKRGLYSFDDSSKAWTYANSLGTALLEEATLEVDDQILERITGDSNAVVSTLFPDLNGQLGVADVGGRKSIADVKTWDGTTIVPTDDMWVTVPLQFSMLRGSRRGTFPLIACREGTMRIRVTLKRFDELVRINSGSRASCTDTPLAKSFRVNNLAFVANQGAISETIVAARDSPKLAQIHLLAHGYFLDGHYREMLLRQPFERPFREIQHFDFTEPLKYAVSKNSSDTILVQLPIEANQPIEEIVWFLRRKAAITLNNDWVNYSSILEKDYDPIFSPLEPLLVSAAIQANGMDLVSSQSEDWFRSHIARAHRGGRQAYDSYIYGYSFARNPGQFNTTGSLNASRLNSLRLTLEVRSPNQMPGGTDSLEWEVHVYVFAFQWIRFGNGICNKVFSD